MKSNLIFLIFIEILGMNCGCNLKDQQSRNIENEKAITDTTQIVEAKINEIQCDVCDTYTYTHFNNQNDILYSDEEIGEMIGHDKIDEFKNKMINEPKAHYALSLSMPELLDGGMIRGKVIMSVSDRLIGDAIFIGTFLRMKNEENMDGLIKLTSYSDQYSGGEKTLSTLKNENMISFKLHPEGIILKNLTLTIPLDLDSVLFIGDSNIKRGIDNSSTTINTGNSQNIAKEDELHEKESNEPEDQNNMGYDKEILRQRNIERQYRDLAGDFWYEFYPLMVVATDRAYFYEREDKTTKSNKYCIRGNEVAIEKVDENWVYASYSDGSQITKGFLNKEELETTTKLVEETFGDATSLLDGLRVRLKPELSERVLYTMYRGEKARYAGFKTNYSTDVKVKNIEFYEPWYYIMINDTIKGWVNGCCIEIKPDSFGGE